MIYIKLMYSTFQGEASTGRTKHVLEPTPANMTEVITGQFHSV